MPVTVVEVLNKGDVIIDGTLISMGKSKELEVTEEILQNLKNIEKKGVLKIVSIKDTTDNQVKEHFKVPEPAEDPSEQEVKEHFKVPEPAEDPSEQEVKAHFEGNKGTEEEPKKTSKKKTKKAKSE